MKLTLRINRTSTTENVPSRLIAVGTYLFYIFLLLQLIEPVYLESSGGHAEIARNQDARDASHRAVYPETTLYLDGLEERDELYPFTETVPLRRPTPPLDLNFSAIAEEQRSIADRERGISDEPISPSRVYTSIERFTYGGAGFESPLYQLQQQHSNPVDNLDTATNFDVIESGSGNWETPEGSNGNPEDSLSGTFSYRDAIAPGLMSTPSFNLPSMISSDSSDRPPLLNRRMPKLTATAGQVWRYFIPAETFVDEDGNLAQLKSMIYPKQPESREDNSVDSRIDISHDYVGQFNSWLQYDPLTQLLYGFPTESEVGKHEFHLIATDRRNQASNETFEIHIRQHPSTRSFTHLILMSQVRWSPQKYPTLVDALGEFVRKMTAQVFTDRMAYKNFVARYYTIDSPSSVPANPLDDTLGDLATFNSSFSIGWSNASIPVHPCNLSHIETMSKFLLDNRRPPQAAKIVGTNDAAQYDPAPSLIKALDNEFRPTSVSIFLQGACEGENPSTSIDASSNMTNGARSLQEIDNTVGDSLRVRIKIGKLTWKLGQPFEYKIPHETFEMGKNLVTRELQLTLFTIDGLAFDSDPDYNFLEFDPETQTLFGSPYSVEHHVGQRELQLTGRHLKSGQRVHEVFILNIESKDLTTINNRAFRMSLYLGTRTGLFGPKERVALSRKMISALDVGQDMANSRSQDEPDFVVIEIQKFSFGSRTYGDGRLVRVTDGSSSQFTSDNLVEVRQSESSFSDHTPYGRTSYMYKYTWTDEKIGRRGDCPVEVIKENVIYALERGMMEHNFTEEALTMFENNDHPGKNASEKFYERLRVYFEPDLDLKHLRFEPLNACLEALELHDVGDMELADIADKASEFSDHVSSPVLETPISMTSSQQEHSKPVNEINGDEYWSIIVLVILVVALSFVMLMFFLGMRTYRINQDKRFELQVRLAQARQNSMFLSSMVLADQANANDIQRMVHPSPAKSMYIIQDEEKGSRKPVILDNERQALVGNGGGGMLLGPSFDIQKPTAVHMNGGLVQTAPLRPNMTFTLDSIASWQPQAPIMIHNNFVEGAQRSMTLHRRSSQMSRNQQPLVNDYLNHSQSILTVASMGGQPHLVNQPIFYGPLPTVNALNPGPSLMQPQFSNTSSLPRKMDQRRLSAMGLEASGLPVPHGSAAFIMNDNLNPSGLLMNPAISSIKESSVDSISIKNGMSKVGTSSHSSSNPASLQSVLSNPNYPSNQH